MNVENEIYDVIIIGCGPSGIGAGIEFEKMESNLNILILEGRNRIGGRAFTDITRFGENIPVDIGAHYLCHHEKDNFLFNYYIPSDKDFIESDYYDKTIMKIFDENGNIICDDLINKSMKFVEDLLLFVKKYSNEKSDISILDLINSQLENISNEQMKNVVKMFLSCTELHEGSDLNQLSTKCYEKGEGNVQPSDLSINNGLGSLVKQIASKYNLPFKLNSIVTNIDINNDEIIRVSTKDNCSYLCKYVLLTIPLGCLKSKSIIFNPSLPQWKEEAIQNMGLGLLNKIYLQFSQIFWESNLRRISVVHHQFKFYFCLPEHRILALYVSGYVAKQLEQRTDEQIVEEIFNSLRYIYPQITYPIKWLITRWGQDPFAKGSYSSFHCGNDLQILKQLSEETHNGRVHWAGEHTNFGGSIGYVDSGFESGIREANKIINKLQS
jgi:monoamine oxidase